MICPHRSRAVGDFPSKIAILTLGIPQGAPGINPSCRPRLLGIPTRCNDLKELPTVEAVPFAVLLRVLRGRKAREDLEKTIIKLMEINMLNQMSRQITSNHEPEVGSMVDELWYIKIHFCDDFHNQYDIVKTSTVQHGTIGCHQQGQWVVHHNTKQNLVSWWWQLAMLMAMAGDHSTWYD